VKRSVQDNKRSSKAGQEKERRKGKKWKDKVIKKNKNRHSGGLNRLPVWSWSLLPKKNKVKPSLFA
jgi:hypothetical protein